MERLAIRAVVHRRIRLEFHTNVDAVDEGSRDFVEFTERLFFDTREGARQGFSKPVASALYKLCELHDKTFPQFVKIKEDVIPFTFGQKRY